MVSRLTPWRAMRAPNRARARGARPASARAAVVLCCLLGISGAAAGSVAAGPVTGGPSVAGGSGVSGGSGATGAARTARLVGVVPFGVGDQNPAMFRDPRFAWLGVGFARLIVPWDAAWHPAEMASAAQWLADARSAGVQPLVSFDHSVQRPRALPAITGYARAVRAFMRRFPSVSHYEPWDEENQGSEPTSHNPARAAAYFNWLNGACSHCAIVAADLLDGPSMAGWLSRFLAYARRPVIWGLHPYYEM